VRRLVALVAVVAALPAIAACGSSTSSASQAASSTSAAAASATTAPSSASSSPSPAGAGGGGALDAAAFCAFLTKGLPEWKAVGSTVGAQAQYTLAVAGWAGDKLTLDLVQKLDAGATQTCPKVRADVLALIGQSTLAG
jgi:hypothetical protein